MLVSTLSTLAPSVATAQAKPPAEPSPENRTLAETLFFAGRGLMEDGRIVEACAKFAESYRLDPAAGTLLNLAVCHERSGRIAAAWGEFRDALAEARKANRPDRQRLAEDHIGVIEPELPWLSIVVPNEIRVPGLEIKRNGIALQDAAWGTELPADPGDTEVTASAPGYFPNTVHVSLEKRDHKSITLTALRAKPKDVVPTRTEWSSRKTVGFWTLVGGGVAIAGSGVLGLLAQSEKSKSNSECPTWYGETRCTSAGVSANKSAMALAWGADGAFALGVIGAAVGSYLFVTSPTKEVPISRVSVDLDVKPGGAFAGVRGSF